MRPGRRPELVDQLRGKVMSGLALGLIKSGDRLPGVRSLAAEFGVDPRVVLAAFAELEDKGIVERRNRSGVFVRAHTNPQPLMRSEWVVDIALDALQHGVQPAMLGHQLSRVFQSRTLHALVVDSNHDQIWSLADELAFDYGVGVTTVDLDMLGLGNGLPDMAVRPDIVVTTSFRADEVAVIADELRAPMVIVTMCTSLFAEVDRLMESREVFFIVSDPRMARKLEQVFEASSNRSGLRVLIHGRDQLENIPRDAPVYITRYARTLIPHSPLSRRSFAEPRLFSNESARELISLVVQAGFETLSERQSS